MRVYDRVLPVDEISRLCFGEATAGSTIAAQVPQISDHPFASASILLAQSTPVHGRTERVHIPTRLLPFHHGVRVRLSISATAGTGGAEIRKVFIGHVDAAKNFDGRQVQLTFNGQPNVEFAGPKTVTSDFAHFDFDPTRGSIVVSFYSHNVGTINAVSDHVQMGLIQWINGIDVAGDNGLTGVLAWSQAVDRLDFVSWFEIEHRPFASEGLWYWHAESRQWQAAPSWPIPTSTIPSSMTIAPIAPPIPYIPPTISEFNHYSCHYGIR